MTGDRGSLGGDNLAASGWTRECLWKGLNKTTCWLCVNASDETRQIPSLSIQSTRSPAISCRLKGDPLGFISTTTTTTTHTLSSLSNSSQWNPAPDTPPTSLPALSDISAQQYTIDLLWMRNQWEAGANTSWLQILSGYRPLRRTAADGNTKTPTPSHSPAPGNLATASHHNKTTLLGGMSRCRVLALSASVWAVKALHRLQSLDGRVRKTSWAGLIQPNLCDTNRRQKRIPDGTTWNKWRQTTRNEYKYEKSHSEIQGQCQRELKIKNISFVY